MEYSHTNVGELDFLGGVLGNVHERVAYLVMEAVAWKYEPSSLNGSTYHITEPMNHIITWGLLW